MDDLWQILDKASTGPTSTTGKGIPASLQHSEVESKLSVLDGLQASNFKGARWSLRAGSMVEQQDKVLHARKASPTSFRGLYRQRSSSRV